MKNRIEKSKAEKRLKTKPKERVISLSSAALTEREWEKIRAGLPPGKRIKLAVELQLTPLQYRAMYWYCRRLFITPAELASTALACDLDGYNNTNKERHLTYTLSDVLTQFPERRKQLGELFEAYKALDDGMQSAQKRVRTITEKLEKAVAS